MPRDRRLCGFLVLPASLALGRVSRRHAIWMISACEPSRLDDRTWADSGSPGGLVSCDHEAWGLARDRSPLPDGPLALVRQVSFPVRGCSGGLRRRG